MKRVKPGRPDRRVWSALAVRLDRRVQQEQPDHKEWRAKKAMLDRPDPLGLQEPSARRAKSGHLARRVPSVLVVRVESRVLRDQWGLKEWRAKKAMLDRPDPLGPQEPSARRAKSDRLARRVPSVRAVRVASRVLRDQWGRKEWRAKKAMPDCLDLLGSAGAVGEKGEVGPPGPQGVAGARGDIGPAGPRGVVGEKGEVGQQGPRGEDGPRGVAGLRGFDVDTDYATCETNEVLVSALCKSGERSPVLEGGVVRCNGASGIVGLCLRK